MPKTAVCEVIKDVDISPSFRSSGHRRTTEGGYESGRREKQLWCPGYSGARWVRDWHQRNPCSIHPRVVSYAVFLLTGCRVRELPLHRLLFQLSSGSSALQHSRFCLFSKALGSNISHDESIFSACLVSQMFSEFCLYVLIDVWLKDI